jgi:hypothetical protein
MESLHLECAAFPALLELSDEVVVVHHMILSKVCCLSFYSFPPQLYIRAGEGKSLLYLEL